jgi:hypothetical protein
MTTRMYDPCTQDLNSFVYILKAFYLHVENYITWCKTYGTWTSGVKGHENSVTFERFEVVSEALKSKNEWLCQNQKLT